jgi:hypothetical protein
MVASALSGSDEHSLNPVHHQEGDLVVTRIRHVLAGQDFRVKPSCSVVCCYRRRALQEELTRHGSGSASTCSAVR